jgi:hypothetical protein
MTRSFHIVIAVLLIVAFALAGCLPDANSDRDKPVIRLQPPTNLDEVENPKPTDEVSEEAAGNNDSAKPQLTESDLARTSWEDPFRARLWSCEGWRIDEKSMTSGGDAGQAATFLRPYRNAVIECRVSTSTVAVSEPNRTPVGIEIRLLNQSTQQWTSLSLSLESITLAESKSGVGALSKLRRLRSVAREAGNDPSEVEIRLTVTPNRVLVAVDGQMKINAARPASIRNTECLAQFIVHDEGATLSDLRFEGD